MRIRTIALIILILFLFLPYPVVADSNNPIQWLEEAAWLHATEIREVRNVVHNRYWYETYIDVVKHLKGQATVINPVELKRRMVLDIYLDRLTAERLLESDPYLSAWYAQWAVKWQVVAGMIRTN